jgi:hypothetical protein
MKIDPNNNKQNPKAVIKRISKRLVPINSFMGASILKRHIVQIDQ